MRYGSTDLLAETRCLFAPIPCTGGSPEPEDVRSYLDEHHEQLWTEAVKRFRALHETAYLPDHLKGAQSALTEQFRAVDEVAEEVIGAWARQEPPGGHREPDRERRELDPRQPEHLPHHDRPKADGLHPGEGESGVGRTWMWTPPDGPAKLEL